MLVHLKGIGLALCSMFMFATTYAFYKACSPYLSNIQIIFFQSLCGWLMVLPFVMKHKWSWLATPQIGKIALRTLFGLLAIYFITLALKSATLAEVVLFNNTAPLFVPLILWLWYKKTISWPICISLIVGFIGVFIILKPGIEQLHIGLIYACFAGVFSALLLVVIREIAHEPLLRIMFYYFLLMWLILLPFVLISWSIPPFAVWSYVILSAVSMIFAQITFTGALRFASSHEVAPYLYTQVIFAAFIGWIIWGETPNFISVIGMLVVCVGGIMTIIFTQKRV